MKAQLRAALQLEEAGEYAQARSKLRNAAALAQKGSSGAERTAIATASGWVEYRLGHYSTAEQLLADSVSQGTFDSQNDLAEALDRLATVQRERTEYDSAAANYARALKLVQNDSSSAARRLQARILNDRGGQHTYQSDFRSAIEDFQHALETYRKLGLSESIEAARSLNNLGDAHRELGEYPEARACLQHALEIKTRLSGPDHIGTASTVVNLGMVAEAQGDSVAAESYYDRGLAIYEKALGPSHVNVANVAVHYARLQLALGRYPQSLQLFERARAIRQSQFGADSNWLAETLLELVPLYTRMGARAKALRDSKAALSIAVTAGEQQLLYNAYIGYGRTLAAQGHLDAAIFFGKQAVNVIQRMRENITSMALYTQRSFVFGRERVYRNLADWLILRGRLHETEEILDLLKLEELSAYTKGDEQKSDHGVTRAGMVRWEVQAARDLDQAIHRLTIEVTTRHLRPKSSGASRHEFSAGLQRIADSFGSPSSPHRQSDNALEPMAQDSFVGQALVDDTTAIVRYLVLPDKVIIILRTRSMTAQRSIPIDYAELSRQVYSLHHGIRSHQENRAAARSLYEVLIAPVTDQLRASGIRVVALVPDGVLRYVPFASLTDGRNYLVESFALMAGTPALDSSSSPQRAWSSAAAFGVSRTPQGQVLLPNVPLELRRIVRRSADDHYGALPGVILLDEQFTRDNAAAVLAGGPPVVHIASHFVFRSGSLQDSYLLLGDGSHLSLDSIKTGALPLTGVGMLTLSACETAVGESGADGREIESFATLAQRRGAQNVVATLWEVPDLSTSILMAKFYRNLTAHHASPLDYATALREAQLLLLRGPAGPADVHGARSPYADPFFWAPFILLQPLH